jgi:hypothetical protein
MKLVSFFSTLLIFNVIFFTGCASSGDKSDGTAASKASQESQLQDDLKKSPPKWSSSGDADIDVIGEKLWKLVDGSHTRMQQVNVKIENYTEYMQFVRTLESKPGATAESLLAEWKADEDLAKQVPAVEAGAEALAKDLNAFEIFLKETMQLPEILKIASSVESIKAKMDSANFMTKAKLGKALLNLPKAVSYISHCNGVIKSLKANNTALLNAKKS